MTDETITVRGWMLILACVLSWLAFFNGASFLFALSGFLLLVVVLSEILQHGGFND